MASPRSHPPPSQSPILDLEVTVISAKHLKNVNWRNGDLKPYAVVYLDPDCRSATKPDDSASTRPVWNERLSLPLPLPLPETLTLTLDVFHSKPSETPKPLVGTARVHLRDLVADLSSPSPPGPLPIKTLDLRRPSGRPQGKVRLKTALRERSPPLPPPQEQNYQIHPSSAYYYSTRDYRPYSPPPQYANPVPPQYPLPYSAPYADPYSYSSPGYYSSPPPPAPMTARPPVYYNRVPPLVGYVGPSAPVDYSYGEPHKGKGGRMGMGAGLAVGAVAGALGGLALEEGIKYEEDKIAERAESELASRDEYCDYRDDY